MEIFAYLRALGRHWVTLMGGIGSLAMGTASTFGLLATSPRVWWWVSAACFAAGTFLAWKDEYDTRRRLEAERVGPKLVLEHDTSGQQAVWKLTNSGSDALNVTAEAIRGAAEHYVDMKDVARIPPGGSHVLEFKMFQGGNVTLGPTKNPTVVFEAALRRETYPAEDMQRRGHPKIPVRILYNDTVGRQFETICTIHWNSFASTGHVVHGTIRQVIPAPRWRRPWAYLTAKVTALRKKRPG